MRTDKKRSIKKSTAKVLLAGVLSFGAVGAFAQAPPPPQPPPPPGELLEKLNPFKKKTKTVDKRHKTNKDKSNKDDILTPDNPRTPPPPPNPIDLIKKKKTPPPPPVGGNEGI